MFRDRGCFVIDPDCVTCDGGSPDSLFIDLTTTLWLKSDIDHTNETFGVEELDAEITAESNGAEELVFETTSTGGTNGVEEQET